MEKTDAINKLAILRQQFEVSVVLMRFSKITCVIAKIINMSDFVHT